jgi:hypothetical protein
MALMSEKGRKEGADGRRREGRKHLMEEEGKEGSS